MRGPRTTHTAGRHPVRTAITACLVGLLLAGCGGAGEPDDGETFDQNNPPPLLQASTALVVADVDDDGRPDLLEVPFGDPLRASDEPVRCWQGLPSGQFSDEMAWADREEVEAIRHHLEHRTDEEILGDEGANCVEEPCPTRSHLPYAVLHLIHSADEDVVGPPMIDELLPMAGRPGALIGIDGSALAGSDSRTLVLFDDLEARVLIARPRFLLVQVPERAPLGLVDVVVTRMTADDTWTSTAEPFRVEQAALPMLERVRPAPVVPGILAVLDGAHLGGPLDDVEVEFGGVLATEVLPVLEHVLVRVPDGALTGDLIVRVNGVASNALEVEVAESLPAPVLTRVTPGAAAPGSLVRLDGSNLFLIGERPAVRFGETPARVFSREPDALVVVVPRDAGRGITVEVDGRRSDALGFDVLDRGPPTLTTASSDTVRPGDVVDLRGTDLYDLGRFSPDQPLALPQVTLAGKPVWFVFPTVEGLRIVVPFHAESGDLQVELGSTTSNALSLTVR